MAALTPREGQARRRAQACLWLSALQSGLFGRVCVLRWACVRARVRVRVRACVCVCVGALRGVLACAGAVVLRPRFSRKIAHFQEE